MSNGKKLPITFLCLYGISEEFDIADFCEFVKKGFCSNIQIGFAQNASEDYRDDFKAAIEETKNKWSLKNTFPNFSYLKS